MVREYSLEPAAGTAQGESTDTVRVTPPRTRRGRTNDEVGRRRETHTDWRGLAAYLALNS